MILVIFVYNIKKYRALYEDGKIISKPKPCAGNQGTIITVSSQLAH
jgi:DNA mismatch repair ATPase MutL